MTRKDATYDELLARMGDNHRLLKYLLDRRHYIRKISLALILEDEDEFMSGVEQFMSSLLIIGAEYDKHSRLRHISFLISRISEDFEAALESCLAGYYYITSDRMRDVLEIELLLKNFLLDHTRIEDWLNGNDDTIKNKYNPNAMRQRIAKGLGVLVEDLRGSEDYKAHSRMLHLSPKVELGNILMSTPGSFRKMMGRDAVVWLLMGFDEILFHADVIIDTSWQLLIGMLDEPAKRGLNELELGRFRTSRELARSRNEQLMELRRADRLPGRARKLEQDQTLRPDSG